MQEISVKCDICRKTYPKDGVSEIRIGEKMHDLCRECSGKLEKVLQGTGRVVPPSIQVPGQVPYDWQKGLNDPVILPTITVPNNMPYTTINMGGVTSIPYDGSTVGTSGFMTTTTSGSLGEPTSGSLQNSTPADLMQFANAVNALLSSPVNDSSPPKSFNSSLIKVQSDAYAENVGNALFAMSPAFFDSAGMKWKK